LASMGPSSLDDGDEWPMYASSPGYYASMGPSSLDDGDSLCMRLSTMGFNASMGPSSLDDGDITMVVPFVGCSLRFNGAVVPRRRRRLRRLPVRGRCCRLQWGRRPSTTETPKSTSRSPPADPRFNGAVVPRRRRHVESRVMGSAAFTLQWGRRPSTTETARGT